MASNQEVSHFFKMLEQFDKYKNWDYEPDCQIIPKTGELLNAHKLVLAKASPMMRDHFYGSINSKSMDKIESEFDEKIMIAIRKYAYQKTTAQNEDYDFYCQLIKAADFYTMDELKTECSILLLKQCGLDSDRFKIFEFIEIAEKYNLSIILDQCYHQLCSYYIENNFCCFHYSSFECLRKNLPDEMIFGLAEKLITILSETSNKITYCPSCNNNSVSLYKILSGLLRRLRLQYSNDPKRLAELKVNPKFQNSFKIYYLDAKELNQFLYENNDIYNAEDCKKLIAIAVAFKK